MSTAHLENELSPFERKALEHLMATEASVADPYSLQHAKAGTSGYSIGHIQIDFAASGHKEMKQKLISDILNHTRTDAGKELSEEEREVLTAIFYSSTRRFSKEQLRRINKAIQTAEVKKAIDKATITRVQETVAHVEGNVSKIADKLQLSDADRKLLFPDQMKLLLVDYHNQLNFQTEGYLFDTITGAGQVAPDYWNAKPNGVDSRGRLRLTPEGTVQRRGNHFGVSDMLFFYTTPPANRPIT